ncbi:putative Ig domain-containing protein [Litorilituus lipolyticus]|uniref:Dystroglycan-type cadherin-like domain-containing protein n=1 Tax=Litorilituus lipolyticus TaxID=2491017 RepID=A0A502KX02_9GAMM|nr:putative Ig domain-containing protein [Litorilituus lipolyticus]TPH15624.1 hypothetical protein EPA86_08585 [Litorilituus lipolyticus]
MFEVDINQEYISNSNFDYYDPTSYHRLGKNLIFVGKTDDGFSELYALNPDTDEIVLLFNKLYEKDVNLKFNSIRMKPYSSNEFIVQATAYNGVENHFITDGTNSGTIKWTPAFELRYSHEPFGISSHYSSFKWKTDNEEYFYTQGLEVYKYDARSNEYTLLGDKPKIGSPAYLNDKQRLNEQFFYSDSGKKHIYELIDFNKSMVFDDFQKVYTSIGSVSFADFHKKIYFTYKKNDKSYFASFGADSGFTDLISIEDIPECHQSTEIVTGIDQVINKGDYVYFRTEQNCLYRVNEQNGDIKGFSETQLGVHSNFRIFAANSKGLIIKGNSSKGNENQLNAYYDLFQVDFTQDSILPLFPHTSFMEKIIKLVQGGDDYLFAYVSYFCDRKESCDRKSLFRLNVHSFVKESIRGRIDFHNQIGHEDIESNFYNKHPIYKGNLYLEGKFPYPGLYKTSPDAKYFKPILLSKRNRQTDRSWISSIHTIDNGWLLRSGEHSDYVKYYGLTFNGKKYEFTLDYGISNFVWYDSGNTAYITTTGNNLFAINLVDFTTQEIVLPSGSDVINIINSQVFSRKDSIWTVTDLKSNITYEIGNENADQVFTCSDKLYFLAGNSLNNKLMQFDNGESTTILGESEQLYVYQNTRSTGKLVIRYDHEVKVFDCASETLTTAFSITLPESNVVLYDEIYFNKFNNKSYFIWKGSLYEVSLEDNENRIIYNDFSSNISLTSSWEPIFTLNGIYLKNHHSDDLFIVKNDEMLKVFDSKPEDLNIDIGEYKVSANGKYLYGVYATRTDHVVTDERIITYKELFIFDTETAQMHMLDLRPGVEGSVKGEAIESSSFIAFRLGGTEKSNEISVLDIECILKQHCVNIVENRTPIVESGEEYFYETGDLVNIPYRASDPDLGPLTYKLNNQPSWLSIDNNGLINGFIPNGATGIFDNIEVIVSDDESETTSLPYTFNIKNRNRSPISNLHLLSEIKLKVDEDYTLNLYPFIEDIDGDPLILSLSPSIEGIALDQQGNLIISSAPAGNYTIQISINDSVSEETVGSISIVVEESISNVPTPVTDTPSESSSSGGGSIGISHLLVLLTILFLNSFRLRVRQY